MFATYLQKNKLLKNFGNALLYLVPLVFQLQKVVSPSELSKSLICSKPVSLNAFTFISRCCAYFVESGRGGGMMRNQILRTFFYYQLTKVRLATSLEEIN